MHARTYTQTHSSQTVSTTSLLKSYDCRVMIWRGLVRLDPVALFRLVLTYFVVKKKTSDFKKIRVADFLSINVNWTTRLFKLLLHNGTSFRIVNTRIRPWGNRPINSFRTVQTFQTWSKIVRRRPSKSLINNQRSALTRSYHTINNSRRNGGRCSYYP